jgi:predicted outer membrane repeat protein
MSLTCIDATQVNENTTVATDFQSESLDSESADFSSLSDDINNCSETKLFKLTRNYTYDSQNDAEYVNGINITIDDLTIDGQGHTLNAKKEAKIFNIQSKNVVLRNIIIINAFANSNGGAIYWEGSNGTLSNSIIKDSYCPKIGGGVYFCKAAIIENTRFINNYAYFGGAVDLEAESTVTNCEFEGNYAKYLGGGIFSSENAYILNSNFTEN